MCLFKDRYFLQHDHFWATLWNKPLPIITKNNMYALTMNYAPSLLCIYIFILA